jgi:hypothetical protein
MWSLHITGRCTQQHSCVHLRWSMVLNPLHHLICCPFQFKRESIWKRPSGQISCGRYTRKQKKHLRRRASTMLIVSIRRERRCCFSQATWCGYTSAWTDFLNDTSLSCYLKVMDLIKCLPRSMIMLTR